jgi:hypothetical protein
MEEWINLTSSKFKPCASKDNINKVKKQPTAQNKVFAKCGSENSLLSRI